MDPSNRETRVGPPGPIVIEKFVQRAPEHTDGDSCGSSMRFSVLSEERLQTAVRLAKRDLRRRRQQSLISPPLTSSPCKQEHDSQDGRISDYQQVVGNNEAYVSSLLEYQHADVCETCFIYSRSRRRLLPMDRGVWMFSDQLQSLERACWSTPLRSSLFPMDQSMASHLLPGTLVPKLAVSSVKKSASFRRSWGLVSRG